MDGATLIIFGIVGLVFAITAWAVYTAVGPGSENLEDPLLNHSHGPNGHNHGLFHRHGRADHSHDHDHAHDHSHDHAHGHSHDHEQAAAPAKEVVSSR
ncbi:MAG: photosystem II reaction center protein PsbN [Cyanobacteria bacterium P01_F01_bin.42]